MTYIDIPENLQIPEGVKEGDEFRQLVTFKLGKKKLCLTAIGEIPMDDDEDFDKAVVRKVIEDE